MTLTADSLAWQAGAACTPADLDLLFGPDTESDEARQAREQQAKTQLCAGCPVRRECLSHAIAGNVRHGVWGGLGETERRNYRASLMRNARRARRLEDGAAA